LTLTNLVPVGEKPFNYVLVYDRRELALASNGKIQLVLSRLLLHSLTRTGKDSGSVVFFDGGVDTSKGSTTSADDILAVAETIQPGDNGFVLLDAIREGVKVLDKMESGRPRFVFVVSLGRPSIATDRFRDQSDVWNKDQAKVESLLIASHTLLIAVTMNDWNDRPNAALGLETYRSVIGGMTSQVGGRLLDAQSASSEFKIAKDYRKDFDNLARLFQNWYWLRLQPTGLRGEPALNLRTAAHCDLVAPSRLIVGRNKPQ